MSYDSDSGSSNLIQSCFGVPEPARPKSLTYRFFRLPHITISPGACAETGLMRLTRSAASTGPLCVSRVDSSGHGGSATRDRYAQPRRVSSSVNAHLPACRKLSAAVTSSNPGDGRRRGGTASTRQERLQVRRGKLRVRRGKRTDVRLGCGFRQASPRAAASFPAVGQRVAGRGAAAIELPPGVHPDAARSSRRAAGTAPSGHDLGCNRRGRRVSQRARSPAATPGRQFGGRIRGAGAGQARPGRHRLRVIACGFLVDRRRLEVAGRQQSAPDRHDVSPEPFPLVR